MVSTAWVTGIDPTPLKLITRSRRNMRCIQSFIHFKYLHVPMEILPSPHPIPIRTVLGDEVI